MHTPDNIVDPDEVHRLVVRLCAEHGVTRLETPADIHAIVERAVGWPIEFIGLPYAVPGCYGSVRACGDRYRVYVHLTGDPAVDSLTICHECGHVLHRHLDGDRASGSTHPLGNPSHHTPLLVDYEDAWAEVFALAVRSLCLDIFPTASRSHAQATGLGRLFDELQGSH